VSKGAIPQPAKEKTPLNTPCVDLEKIEYYRMGLYPFIFISGTWLLLFIIVYCPPIIVYYDNIYSTTNTQ
jgi:hypothetical protein